MQKHDDTRTDRAARLRRPSLTAYAVIRIAGMLRMGAWIGTQEIRRRLLDECGIETDLRTIQRHLNAMAEIFPIEHNDSSPRGYRWKRTGEAAEMIEIARAAA